MRICGFLTMGPKPPGALTPRTSTSAPTKSCPASLDVLLDKDAAGVIVNEDGRDSGSEVRIEVGYDPLQMDGIGAHGLLVGETMRLACSGERGELASGGEGITDCAWLADERQMENRIADRATHR